MKKYAMMILLVCACCDLQAQTNFVKNPDFEQFAICPNNANQLVYTKYWTAAIDTTSDDIYQPEYMNTCANKGVDRIATTPENIWFYQYPHSGDGMAAATFYFDKSILRYADRIKYRQYVQGRLYSNLLAGKEYCVSFWINLTETSGYAQNKVGAYFDNGNINKFSIEAGTEITSVSPQIYTNDVIDDTANWVKIEGSFTATGNESYITIGNFFPNSVTTAVPKTSDSFYTSKEISYYLIDDVSVVELNLRADAGKDSYVETGKRVAIGRVGDTTARALDCKWYYKGNLIDSGAIIDVNAASTIGVIDTYVVVQTICGLVRTDTVTVTTVPLRVKEWAQENMFSVYPNPSDGRMVLGSTAALKGPCLLSVYDVTGRLVHKQETDLGNKQAMIDLRVETGTYFLELRDGQGLLFRERILVR